jgi:hypothetical protein
LPYPQCNGKAAEIADVRPKTTTLESRSSIVHRRVQRLIMAALLPVSGRCAAGGRDLVGRGGKVH